MLIAFVLAIASSSSIPPSRPAADRLRDAGYSLDQIDGILLSHSHWDHVSGIPGDCSVVLTPAGGHTPGSVVTFVTLPSGRRYAFVGDLVWAREAIELPAERPWLARRMVDHDTAVVRRNIVHLHRISKKIPDLIFVPAHDRRVFETMAAFPDFES
ncbi:MAG: MBL fold metallo-hydrolase [Thermoanaerobaculia bacterium]